MKTQAVEFSLLDAPQPWLLKLISGQYLDSASKLSLFQTCRQLNEMVMQHSNSTSLILRPLSGPVDAHVKTLQVASRHGHKIRLVLTHVSKERVSYLQRTDERMQMGQAVCRLLLAAHKLDTTSHLTSLQLERAGLDALLPPAIGQACPNLTSLALHRCRINGDATVNVSNAHMHLQSLELTDVSVSTQHLQAQLKGLVALQSLTVVNSPCSGAPNASAVDSVAGQLTHLHWFPINAPSRALDWAKLGATLKHLQLDHIGVSDAELKIFIGMPFLTHVEAWIHLHTSFAGQPCKLQEWTTYSINIKTLAFLPLHSGFLLKVLSPDEKKPAYVSVDSTSLAEAMDMAQQAVTNLHKAQGVQWNKQEVWLVVNLHALDSVEFSEILIQTLPLFSHARELSVSYSDDAYEYDYSADQILHVTGGAVQALCKFASKRKDTLRLLLTGCLFEAEHAVSLVKAMPCGSTLQLCLSRLRTEQVITQMCCAAQHKLTLHIRCRDPLPSGYMDRIKSAVQPHQHVEVTVSLFTEDKEEYPY